MSKANNNKISTSTTIVVTPNGSKERSDTKTQSTSQRPGSWVKYVSLVTLAIQNASLILIMSYSRSQPGTMYFSTTAVVMSEIIKIVTCLFLVLIQEQSLYGWVSALYSGIVGQPVETLKLAVPALIYTLQNNLQFVAVSNLNAATFQVIYQMKILTTALFSVCMLYKRLSMTQWFSLFLLFVGIAAVQLEATGAKNDNSGQERNVALGLIAVGFSCLSSGFAGVYFEKILKGSNASIWLRNVQLGLYGSVIGLIGMYLKDGPDIVEHGFFYGYNTLTWTVIVFQALGGLLVAVVVKYADNILKGFATSIAIIISCCASVLLFDFQLTLLFSAGTTLVITAVILYSRPKPASPPPAPSPPTIHIDKK